MIGLPFPGSGLVHGLFMGLGIAAGLVLFAMEVRRRGLHDDRLWGIAGLAVTFGAIGARVLTWPREWDPSQNPSLALWWSEGNRSILAGLVAAWLGVLLGKRVTRYRQPTGDLFAPAVALAMVIGRVGCLLTEDPGRPTGGDWGMVLTAEQAGVVGGTPGVGLHPSFLYEIAFQLLALIVLLRLRDRLPRPGDLFLVYVTGYALFRFAVEFVRDNEDVWWGLTRPQWFLLLLLPLLALRSARMLRPARVGAVDKEGTPG